MQLQLVTLEKEKVSLSNSWEYDRSFQIILAVATDSSHIETFIEKKKWILFLSHYGHYQEWNAHQNLAIAVSKSSKNFNKPPSLVQTSKCPVVSRRLKKRVPLVPLKKCTKTRVNNPQYIVQRFHRAKILTVLEKNCNAFGQMSTLWRKPCSSENKQILIKKKCMHLQLVTLDNEKVSLSNTYAFDSLFQMILAAVTDSSTVYLD